MRALLGLLLASGLCLGLVSACGGGGGGSSPSTAAFVGGYRVVLFTATGNPSVSTESAWGTITADGLGGMTGSVDGNVNTLIVPAAPMDGWTTRVESDLDFFWQVAGAPGTDVFSGGIRADGGAGALTVTQSGMRPGLLLVARPSGVYSASTLNARYHACGFRYRMTTGAAASYFGTMTFDGSGGGEHLLMFNQAGTVWTPLTPSAMTYTVMADGRIGTDSAGIVALRGSIFGGGDVILAGGSALASNPPVVFAMVKPSTSASAALLSGTYEVAGIQYDPGAGVFTSQGGTAVADGLGVATVTFTENTEGVILTRPAEDVTYTVGPDGALVITPAGGGDPFHGGVSPSGDYAILGGAFGTGANPAFYVLMRR